MTTFGEITICGIRATASPEWSFHEFDGLILARRESRGGSLQLSTAFRNDCIDTPTAETCEKAAREWLSDDQLGAFRREPLAQEGDLVGWATVGSESEEGRVWYVLRDRQLVLALYRRRSSGAPDAVFELEVREADSILRSVEWSSTADS